MGGRKRIERSCDVATMSGPQRMLKHPAALTMPACMERTMATHKSISAYAAPQVNKYTTLLLPLRPNSGQAIKLCRYAGTARWAYNWALATSNEEYRKTGKRPSAYDLIKRLTTMKRTPEFAWLAEVSKQVPQYAIHNLDAAFQGFFRRVKAGDKKPGYPKFKKRGGSKSSFTIAELGSTNPIRGRKIHVPSILFNTRRHRGIHARGHRSSGRQCASRCR